jgi:hypothetical protein
MASKKARAALQTAILYNISHCIMQTLLLFEHIPTSPFRKEGVWIRWVEHNIPKLKESVQAAVNKN